MNQIQIECFITAANTGTLAAAARKLFLTQQSVSQNIQNLEKETGCILFTRNKNGVSLTEDGKRLYTYAESWENLYHNTQQLIKEYYSAIGTVFRIGITEYVDPLGSISSGLAAFREKYKDITIEGMQHRNRVLLKEIENGNLDVVIINELQIVAGGDFDYIPFAKEDLRLFLSGYHPNQSPEHISVNELKEVCAAIPHISASYGVWDTSDWEEISHRTSSYLGYDFIDHYEAVNFRSCILNLDTIPCSVVCDTRFGYPPSDPEIFNIPLNTDSRLCILWHRKNENPLIHEFIRHMTEYYMSAETAG